MLRPLQIGILLYLTTFAAFAAVGEAVIPGYIPPSYEPIVLPQTVPAPIPNNPITQNVQVVAPPVVPPSQKVIEEISVASPTGTPMPTPVQEVTVVATPPNQGNVVVVPAKKLLLPPNPQAVGEGDPTANNMGTRTNWKKFVRDLSDCTQGTYILNDLESQAAPVINQILGWDANGACYFTLVNEEKKGTYTKTECHFTTDTLDTLVAYYNKLIDGVSVTADDKSEFMNAYASQCDVSD